MVGNPGSSTRCLQCRQRKKKCGLEQPSCLRCVRSGLQCSGPGQTNVFINRNGSDLFQRTDKAALNAAFGSRHASPANLEVLDGLVTQSSSCILYDAIAAEFAPKPLTGIFSGDRSPDKVPYYSGIAKAVRALTGMASGCTNLLDLGVFTLLTKYYGTFQRDEALVDLANASYTKVLGLFHQRLVGVNTLLQYNSADHRSYQAAFYVCLTMQFFEMINWPPSEQALEIHVDGALAILEKLGPHLTQKVIDPRIFDSFRVMAVSILLCQSSVPRDSKFSRFQSPSKDGDPYSSHSASGKN
ncbi:hypothetical protein F5Y19DRAFT_132416 [Xylariaceae sp. FL1651]|nr:hypothetical protein F5Y19DRAFT_132416 [Xylariaceae sp. FL1651]